MVDPNDISGGHTRSAGVDASVRHALRTVLPALVDGLPEVLAEVGRTFGESWPDYAAFLNAENEEVVRAGGLALGRIVVMAERSLLDRRLPAADESDNDLVLFEEIGRNQWRTGRSLEVLMSAYQSGARIAWRQMAAISIRHALPAAGVALLADAVFAFVDQLCAASARGYVAEQSASSCERERARRELSEMLLSDRSDGRLVEATARRASWPMPPTAAVVLIPDEAVAHDLLARLGPSALSVRRPDAVGAIVPDAAGPGQRDRLRAVLRGASAVVGPSVGTDRLPAALRITQETVRLQQEGLLRGDPLFVDEHLDAVIVRRDSRLLEALQAQVLAPLQPLPSDTRNRLAETLACWLVHLGDRQAMADELHVHRQTVRYRLGQLRDLFGDTLDDPDFRRKLLLALAWQPPGREAVVAVPAQSEAVQVRPGARTGSGRRKG